MTCCGSVRADAMCEVGGFDETITYGEDLDLAYRLRRRYPTGLCRAHGAVAGMLDAGTLQVAREKMAVFAGDNLSQMARRYPTLLADMGLAGLQSPRSLTGRGLGVLFQPRISRWLEKALPVLPTRLSSAAIRYIIGQTIVEHYLAGCKQLDADG